MFHATSVLTLAPPNTEACPFSWLVHIVMITSDQASKPINYSTPRLRTQHPGVLVLEPQEASGKQVPRYVVCNLLRDGSRALENGTKHPENMDLTCVLAIFSLDSCPTEQARHLTAFVPEDIMVGCT